MTCKHGTGRSSAGDRQARRPLQEKDRKRTLRHASASPTAKALVCGTMAPSRAFRFGEACWVGPSCSAPAGSMPLGPPEHFHSSAGLGGSAGPRGGSAPLQPPSSLQVPRHCCQLSARPVAARSAVRVLSAVPGLILTLGVRHLVDSAELPQPRPHHVHPVDNRPARSGRPKVAVSTASRTPALGKHWGGRGPGLRMRRGGRAARARRFRP